MEYEPDMKIDRHLHGGESAIFYKPRESGTWVKLDDSREMPAEFVVVFQPRKGVDEPLVEMHFAVIDGVPQCRGVLVSAIKGKREVRAGDLRAIPVEDVLESVSAHMTSRVIADDQGNVIHTTGRPFAEDLIRGNVAAVRDARRQTKRKVTDELLREVAEVYRQNLGSNPTEAVRGHFGVAPRTAGLYVRRARDAGFLGEAIKGKAGEL